MSNAGVIPFKVHKYRALINTKYFIFVINI